jgi:ABC-type hemin transport system substrate-binding protein
MWIIEDVDTPVISRNPTLIIGWTEFVSKDTFSKIGSTGIVSVKISKSENLISLLKCLNL